MFVIKAKTMVWGIGNELYGDDQVGIAACRYLLEMDLEEILDVFLCYTVPGNYVSKIEKHRPTQLIILDASDMGLAPGGFRRFSLSEIKDVSFTNHDMPINLMLEPYQDITTIVGIQPKRVELGAPMTSLLEKTALTVARIILEGRLEEIPAL